MLKEHNQKSPLQTVKEALHGPKDGATQEKLILGSVPVQNSVTGVPPQGIQGLPVGGLHIAGLHSSTTVPGDAPLGESNEEVLHVGSPRSPAAPDGLNLTGVISEERDGWRNNAFITAIDETPAPPPPSAIRSPDYISDADSEDFTLPPDDIVSLDIKGGEHGAFSPRSKKDDDTTRIRSRYHHVKSLWSHLKESHLE